MSEAKRVQVRWEHGTYTSGVSRFLRVVLWRLCLTAQWDLLDRREWDVSIRLAWGTATPEWRKDYLRVYFGPGVIPF